MQPGNGKYVALLVITERTKSEREDKKPHTSYHTPHASHHTPQATLFLTFSTLLNLFFTLLIGHMPEMPQQGGWERLTCALAAIASI
jgi:hypothetical protein